MKQTFEFIRKDTVIVVHGQFFSRIDFADACHKRESSRVLLTVRRMNEKDLKMKILVCKIFEMGFYLTIGLVGVVDKLGFISLHRRVDFEGPHRKDAVFIN